MQMITKRVPEILGVALPPQEGRTWTLGCGPFLAFLKCTSATTIAQRNFDFLSVVPCVQQREVGEQRKRSGKWPPQNN